MRRPVGSLAAARRGAQRGVRHSLPFPAAARPSRGAGRDAGALTYPTPAPLTVPSRAPPAGAGRDPVPGAALTRASFSTPRAPQPGPLCDSDVEKALTDAERARLGERGRPPGPAARAWRHFARHAAAEGG